MQMSKNIPNFIHFKNYIKDKINTERLIAQRKGKIDLHNAKWHSCQHKLRLLVY